MNPNPNTYFAVVGGNSWIWGQYNGKTGWIRVDGPGAEQAVRSATYQSLQDGTWAPGGLTYTLVSSNFQDIGPSARMVVPGSGVDPLAQPDGVDSKGVYQSIKGTPTTVGSPYVANNPNNMGNNMNNGFGNSRTKKDLLRTILAIQPPLTDAATGIRSAQDDMDGAATLAEWDGYAVEWITQLRQLASAQKVIGNLALAQIASTQGGQINLSDVGTLGLASAGSTLQTVLAAASDSVSGGATADVGGYMADAVRGFKTYASQLVGILGTLGIGVSGNGGLGFALLLAGGAGGGTFSKSDMIQALTLGPALSTFLSECDDAITALDAAVTYVATNTAMGDFTPAANTFITAITQANLIGAAFTD